MVRAVFLIAALVLSDPARSYAAETITSDTVDYCTALAGRMVQQELPPSVRVLFVEGRAMCERGHVVGGLRRIRLAMMILRGRRPSPDAGLNVDPSP